jgi:hypothetical protein
VGRFSNRVWCDFSLAIGSGKLVILLQDCFPRHLSCGSGKPECIFFITVFVEVAYFFMGNYQFLHIFPGGIGAFGYGSAKTVSICNG